MVVITFIGYIIIAMACFEMIRGVAWEKSGFVYRKEQPLLFWFSSLAKLVVGLAILNIETLQRYLN